MKKYFLILSLTFFAYGKEKGFEQYQPVPLEMLEGGVKQINEDSVEDEIINFINSGNDINALTAYAKLMPFGTDWSQFADVPSRDIPNIKAALLHHAAANGELREIKELLKNGADIHIKDTEGDTALHWAFSEIKPFIFWENFTAFWGETTIAFRYAKVFRPQSKQEIREKWMKFYADIRMDEDDIHPIMGRVENIPSEQEQEYIVEQEYIGQRKAHEVFWQEKKDIITFLIENGADVNAKGEGGTTPLQLAVARGSQEAVALLIANGANINMKDDKGTTALHVAAFRGDEQVFYHLLKEGAIMESKNNEGKTVLDIAQEQKHKELIKKIKQIK